MSETFRWPAWSAQAPLVWNGVNALSHSGVRDPEALDLTRASKKGLEYIDVHHLGRSQSERIVWLCEELGLGYELVRYTRDPVTILSPPELKALHPLGSAPLITDGSPPLESGAVRRP